MSQIYGWTRVLIFTKNYLNIYFLSIVFFRRYLEIYVYTTTFPLIISSLLFFVDYVIILGALNFQIEYAFMSSKS